MKNAECQICLLNPPTLIKGIISYSKQLYTNSTPNFHQRLIHKLKIQNIQQVDLNDEHLCFEIDQNICYNCWQFMYEGFYCSKCKTYNNQNQGCQKVCCFCKANYCTKCDRELDLFSQNKLCEICQTKENFGFSHFLISYLFCLLIPCIAFKFLLKKLLETIDQINYSQTKRTMAVISFTLVFPIIYCLSIIFYLIILFFKLISMVAKNECEQKLNI